MKTFSRSQLSQNATTHQLLFDSQTSDALISTIDRRLFLIQKFVTAALNEDHRMIDLKLYQASEAVASTVGAVTRIAPVVPGALATLSSAAKERLLRSALNEVALGIRGALDETDIARIAIIDSLNNERLQLTEEIGALQARYSASLETWDGHRIAHYKEQREYEYQLQRMHKKVSLFKAKIARLSRQAEIALGEAERIQQQGKATGHQLAYKRLPEQHGLTQHLYQMAVIRYMKNRFQAGGVPSWLKDEEVNMLEKAFPHRFVMHRRFGESAKQRSEMKRAKLTERLKLKGMLKAQLEAGVRSLVLRDNASLALERQKHGAHLAHEIAKQLNRAVERRFKALNMERTVENIVNMNLLVSPHTGERVCLETFYRHRRLAQAVTHTDTIDAHTMIKLSSFSISDETKFNIVDILQIEEARLNDAEHYQGLCDPVAWATDISLSLHPDVESAYAQDMAKADRLIAVAEAVGSTDRVDEKIRLIDEFEIAFRDEFSLEASDELASFSEYQTIVHIKEEYRQQADAMRITAISERMTFFSSKITQFYQTMDEDVARLGEAVRHATMTRDLLRLESEANSLSYQLRTPSVSLDFLSGQLEDIFQRIHLLDEQYMAHVIRIEEALSESSIVDELHLQALDIINKLSRIDGNRFNHCHSLDSINDTYEALLSEINVLTQESDRFSSTDSHDIFETKAAAKASVLRGKEAARIKLTQSIHLQEKSDSLAARLIQIEREYQRDRNKSHFHPQTNQAVGSDISDVKASLRGFNNRDLTPENTGQLIQLEQRIERLEEQIMRLRELDHLALKTSAFLPDTIKHIVNADRTGFTTEEKVAQDGYAASVVAVYLLDPFVSETVIDRLQRDPDMQDFAFKKYHRQYVFDDMCSDRLQLKMDELIGYVDRQIIRISRGNTNPSGKTKQKIDEFGEELLQLQQIKNFIRQGVSFTAIHTALMNTAIQVIETAKIQRGFFKDTRSSKALGMDSEFARLVREIETELQEQIEALKDSTHRMLHSISANEDSAEFNEASVTGGEETRLTTERSSANETDDGEGDRDRDSQRFGSS